ncbi:MAG: sugar phosphate isomerase/epimerase [Bacilli bacterium]|nr:sugar phosphate isomerase/epimerase [Bacilli bacterium]
MKYGIQQLMLGQHFKTQNKAIDRLNTLEDNGYACIELDGFMIRHVPYIVKVLTDMSGMPTGNSNKFDWVEIIKETELEVIAIHEDLDTIEKKMDMVIDECKKFHSKYVVITGMYQFDYDSIAELDKLISRLNEAGRALKEKGISLLYHNHNVEFSRLDNGDTSYLYILKNTNPEYVNFELDGYWATDAGANVIKLIETLGSRLKLYHINDRQKKKYGKSMTPIVKFDACELGNGVMDIEGIVNALKSTSCEAIILETHKNWINKNPLESAIISSEFIKSLM